VAFFAGRAPLDSPIALAAACSNGSADQVTTPQAVGMTSTMAPYYADGQVVVYQAMTEVKLPVRKPSDAEEKGLGSAPKGTPYPHAPFLTADDESIEVHYTLTNADTVSHNVGLLIDPWNEFVRWEPGVTVINDEETLPNFGYDQVFVLPAKSRKEGTITADDMHEIAIKLAAAENYLASIQGMDASMLPENPTDVCNNIFNYENRSNSNPPDLFYTREIPPVIAGLTGFDLGIRMSSGDATAKAGNVAVEITMDVQDMKGDRFVPADDSSQKQIGMPPRTLSPPSARF
jgi:hypothetical protein